MKPELANLIADVRKLTGDESLDDEIDAILHRHELLTNTFEMANSSTDVDATIERETNGIRADIRSANKVADRLASSWQEETETQIAASEELRRNLDEMQQSIFDRYAIGSPPATDSGESTSALNAARRGVLRTRVDALYSGIQGMESRLNAFETARKHRIRLLNAIHFFWSFAFPFIFVLLGLFTALMSPLAGIAVALLIFAINWPLDRWVFQPWLNRRFAEQQKSNTVATVNSFYFSRIVMECHLAMLRHQIQEHNHEQSA